MHCNKAAFGQKQQALDRNELIHVNIECVAQLGSTQAYHWLIEARDTFWLSERVKVNSCVVGIEEFDDHVKVRCVDGKEYKVILKKWKYYLQENNINEILYLLLVGGDYFRDCIMVLKIDKVI